MTGLRGIAALHVMLFHYFLGLPLSNPASTFIAHGYLEVDLFFVLSGFVMALNYAHMFESGWSAARYFRFLGRRIARIYPLYFVTTICALILAMEGWLSVQRLASLKMTFVLNVLMVQSWGLAGSLNPPAWSISAEWAAYLAFPLLLIVCLFRRPTLAWAVGAVCVLTLVALSQVPVSWGHQPKPNALMDLSDPRFALPVLRCWAEFSLGLIVFRIRRTTFGIAMTNNPWITFGVCFGWIAFMAVPRTDLMVVLLLPLLVLTLTTKLHTPGRILASRPLEICGQLSYSIYLIHALLRGLLIWMHQFITGFGFRHAQTYAAGFAIAVTLLLSYFAYSMIEIPGRRLLRRVFEGKQPPLIVSDPNCAVESAV